MSQQYNGNVPLERLIDARFKAMREHMDVRFDSLGQAFREHCADNDEDRRDHESRLRVVEHQLGAQGNQTKWGWVMHGAEVVGILLASIFGLRQP